MSSEFATHLNVGDIVVIPELDAERRHLIINTEPPGSAAQIRIDDEGRERIGLPGTLPERLRTFIKVGHWTVEQTLAVEALNSLVGDSLEAIIRASYEKPPYEVPHD
jgi:hypothetical protein